MNGAVIEEIGDGRGEDLGDPESVPHPHRPHSREKRNAAGRISRAYRKREMAREGPPVPRPSSAPQEITDTEETMNPRLMISRAVRPAAMVSALVENSSISCEGIAQQRTVPRAMMQTERARAVR